MTNKEEGSNWDRSEKKTGGMNRGFVGPSSDATLRKLEGPDEPKGKLG